VAYTSDDRAAGLAALESNGGNLRRTARETGISDATLRRWRDETDERKDAANAARMPEARATLTERLRAFVDAALTVAPDKLHDANLRDVFTSVGIAIDKLQLLEGRPTSIDEVRDALSDDDRAARVAALLDRARARRTGMAN
jgi:transposase-like protein